MGCASTDAMLHEPFAIDSNEATVLMVGNVRKCILRLLRSSVNAFVITESVLSDAMLPGPFATILYEVIVPMVKAVGRCMKSCNHLAM